MLFLFFSFKLKMELLTFYHVDTSQTLFDNSDVFQEPTQSFDSLQQTKIPMLIF